MKNKDTPVPEIKTYTPNEVNNINHDEYPNDITLWCKRSDIEQLQTQLSEIKKELAWHKREVVTLTEILKIGNKQEIIRELENQLLKNEDKYSELKKENNFLIKIINIQSEQFNNL